MNFQIEIPEQGVLTYKEAGIAYSFPFCDEDGDNFFVSWPISKKILRLFFAWTNIPPEISTPEQKRISANIIHFFRSKSIRVREVSLPDEADRGFQFHPELFEHKAKASELLNSAEILWMNHYSSIDLLHETFGFEVCGIHEEFTLHSISRILRTGFPHWHYSDITYRDCGRDIGWKFTIHMFPPHSENGFCVDAD